MEHTQGLTSDNDSIANDPNTDEDPKSDLMDEDVLEEEIRRFQSRRRLSGPASSPDPHSTPGRSRPLDTPSSTAPSQVSQKNQERRLRKKKFAAVCQEYESDLARITAENEANTNEPPKPLPPRPRNYRTQEEIWGRKRKRMQEKVSVVATSIRARHLKHSTQVS